MPADMFIKDSIFCWNYLYLAGQLEKVPDEESRDNTAPRYCRSCAGSMGSYQHCSKSTTSQKRNSKMSWEFSSRNLPLKTALQTGGRDQANLVAKQNHTRNAMVGFVPLF